MAIIRTDVYVIGLYNARQCVFSPLTHEAQVGTSNGGLCRRRSIEQGTSEAREGWEWSQGVMRKIKVGSWDSAGLWEMVEERIQHTSLAREHMNRHAIRGFRPLGLVHNNVWIQIIPMFIHQISDITRRNTRQDDIKKQLLDEIMRVRSLETWTREQARYTRV
jgi:hypothetical protein